MKESCARPICSTYSFNTVASRRRQAIREIQLLSDFGYGELTGSMVNAIDANRCKADRCSQMVIEQRHSCITSRCVNQSARDDLVAVEGHAVGVVSPIDACIA